MLGSRWTQVAVLLFALTGVDAALPPAAGAQSAVALNEIQASPKGTIGFGLLGAEIGLAVPALIGLDPVWVYCVVPPVAAGGFAIMGYYLVDQRDLTGLAVTSLVLGVALVIPTLIVTIMGVRYDPEDEFDVPEEEARAARARRLARAGDGLFRWSEEGLLLGLPGIAPVTGRPGAGGELRVGGPAGTEIRVSLLTGVF